MPCTKHVWRLSKVASGDVNSIRTSDPFSDELSALKGSDVLIEFTSPEATLDNLHTCLIHDVKMVIGTTGFQPEHIAQIKEAAEKIPSDLDGHPIVVEFTDEFAARS